MTRFLLQLVAWLCLGSYAAGQVETATGFSLVDENGRDVLLEAAAHDVPTEKYQPSGSVLVLGFHSHNRTFKYKLYRQDTSPSGGKVIVAGAGGKTTERALGAPVTFRSPGRDAVLTTVGQSFTGTVWVGSRIFDVKHKHGSADLEVRLFDQDAAKPPADFGVGSLRPNSSQGMQYSRHLVDCRRIVATGGRGGSGGCLYTKHVLQKKIGPGWPCGGAGGKGGDVVVRAAGTHHSLAHLLGHFHGNPGRPGRKKNLNGESGRNCVVPVPRGVFVRELLPVEEELEEGARRRFERGPLLAELDRPGDEVVVARGGRGGAGNNMARPHEAEEGGAGEERRVELELKSIADVGLVGMPNAGKSTLLGAVSRACPKIAPYPFTTVAPYVGRAEFVDGSALTVADVPGLVEDAHLGSGLGHEFLRHLERTRLLLYVVDVARSVDPFGDFLALRREVELYSADMAAKSCALVATKVDLDPEESLPRADALHSAVQRLRATGGADAEAPVFVRAVAARLGDGVAGLLRDLRSALRQPSGEAGAEP